MTRDVAFGGLAAALGVVAAWDALVALEGEGVPAIRRAVAPLGRVRDLTLDERRRLAVLTALALLSGGWLVVGPLAGLALAAGGPTVVRLVAAARRRRWRAELARAAPALARSLADALAAGHSIRGALADVAPRGGLSRAASAALTQASRSLALGEPTDVVLERLRDQAGSPAFDTLVAAILLQREAGGNLAGLLREMAVGLEEAERLMSDARAATAQARFTGGLVAGLPLAAAALAELAQPGYLRALVSAPLPAALAAVAAVLQVVGFVLIRRLARVRA
jgi:tight adherence protein B